MVKYDKLRKPCVECPFLKTSTAGWLGADRPTHFIESSAKANPTPCHMTVDYTDPEWLAKLADADMCVGAMRFLVNWLCQPRDPSYAAAVDDQREMAPGNTRMFGAFGDVFEQLGDFIDYHERKEITVPRENVPIAQSTVVLFECPDQCGAIDDNVYTVDGHPITCDWMMIVARRCGQHDELLRPDEPECPTPDVDEEAPDAHARKLRWL